MTTMTFPHPATPPHLSEAPDLFLVHPYPQATPSGHLSESRWRGWVHDYSYVASLGTYAPGQVYLSQQTITTNQPRRQSGALRKEVEATMSTGFNYQSPNAKNWDGTLDAWFSGSTSDIYHPTVPANSHATQLQTGETLESMVLRAIDNVAVAMLVSQSEPKAQAVSRYLAQLVRQKYVVFGAGVMQAGNIDTETERLLATPNPTTPEQDIVPPSPLHPVVDEFQTGVEGEPTPTPPVVSDASTLVREIERVAKSSELSVDVDGALSFVVVLEDHTLITGEFTPIGELYAWRYDKTDWTTRTGKIDGEPDVLVIRGWLE